MAKKRTIKKEFSLSGVGLHTGEKATLTFKPGGIHEGIKFIRVDLPGHPVIKAEADSIVYQGGPPRCTSIGDAKASIHTVEHLMSVLAGLGIDNIIIEIDKREVPGLDGSGADFLKAFKEAGLLAQEEEREIFTVKEPVGVRQNGASLYIFPSEHFEVTYTLDYNHPFLRSQVFSSVINEAIFEKEIAPCRTFCLEKEAQELKKQNLGRGATFKNTLVVGDKGVIDNKLRFDNEFARHKVLDFIGDLYLLGIPIVGSVFAVRSGHYLNIQLLKRVVEQKKWYEHKGIVPGYNVKGKKEYDIDDIMKILPHRYPFLLVDRVIEIERGKRAIGVKNVTINDSFFQGHFPTRPVMPGVMMIEAMAQTAGVVVLTNEVHYGKVAFFMAVDNVKFRKVVVPGDQLMMEVEVVKDKAKIAQIHAVSKVGDEVVAEADMVFSFTDSSYLD
ncbi:MAG TPA: UDP-3-O-acyl-N-acetylglucosamine deacetylase [Candidatus Omnitrophota bacterium]|nr:UDP-3-O-acyl-N-acetylglucosamine deacetylase [Candidatus Omnitrophota bacterium]